MQNWVECLRIAPNLQQQGVTPLVMGENWTVIHPRESVALSALGPDKRQALWQGKPLFNGADMIKVWEPRDRFTCKERPRRLMPVTRL